MPCLQHLKGVLHHRRELKEGIRGKPLKPTLPGSISGTRPETRAVAGDVDEDWGRESASSAANTPAPVPHSTVPEPVPARDSSNRHSGATCSPDAASPLPPQACSACSPRASSAPVPATAPAMAGRLPLGSALLAGPSRSHSAGALVLPLLARPRPAALPTTSRARFPHGCCAIE